MMAELNPSTFHKLAEKSSNAILLADSAMTVVYANPAAYQLYMPDPIGEDLLGMPVARFWQEKDMSFVEQTIIPQAMVGDWTGEVQNRRVDGSVFSAWISVFFVPGADAQSTSMAIISHDITARQQAENELRASEERFRHFSTVIKEGVMFHEKGIITDVNPAMVAMLGYSEDADLIGKPILDFCAPSDRAMVLQRVREGINETYEAGLLCKDGSLLPVELTGETYQINGRATRVTTFRDLTARKKAEAERAALQEQIIEAQRHALQELSTPIIPVMDRIIVMPLIGSIDTMRAKDITRALLAGISHYRAKIVIVDITGVPIVDSGVADHLNKTIQAARLKGAQTIITGMSDAVAEAIIDLGIDWSNIQTLSDLQTGLMVATNILGLKLIRA
jgi:rsbT co-antagonist protein RsbR